MIRIERFLVNCLCLAILACAWPVMSVAGAINLPQTGQITCYDTDINIIDCAGTGQDGDVRAGVPWPEPRFVDNGDGTVTDYLTGLIWLKNADCLGRQFWAQALSSCNTLATGACGLTDGSVPGDWRLPNVVELESLVNASVTNSATWLNSQGFNGVDEFPHFWSSTTSAYADYYGDFPSYTWLVSLDYGFVLSTHKEENDYNVWPVRGGQFLETWRTGQNNNFAAGDDGALQTGIAWPVPRFTDNVNGTVTDNLSGLIWLKNANCFGIQSWANALSDSNSLANGSCGLSDGSMAGDWRLPNRKEILSLVDFSRYNPALPYGHPFSNVESAYTYLSASTAFGDRTWAVTMSYGTMTHTWKSHLSGGNVWPVRGGRSESFDQLATITQKADLNGDGVVDGADLAVFLASYGSFFGDENYNFNADFDNDGDVDQDDLKLFSIIFGNLDLPIYLPDVPVLNQKQYTDKKMVSTYVESVGNIEAGGCVPVSFAMLFLGHYNYFGPAFPIMDLSYNSQNIKNLMDEIATSLSVPIPVSKWREFFSWGPDQTRITELEIFENMENYSFVFDSDDYTVTASWSIDYECGTVFSNQQLINSIVARLENSEPIFFIGNIKFPHTSRSGGHASVISGYAKFRGIEYFRVNDTYSHIPQWYEIERGSVCVVDDNCSPNFCPVKLISLDGEKVFTISMSMAWPQHLNISVVPKY